MIVQLKQLVLGYPNDLADINTGPARPVLQVSFYCFQNLLQNKNV